MNKTILILILLCISNIGKSQRGFLLIKKNNKTFESYTTGAPLFFTHHYGYNVQGILAHVKKDSFSILQYAIQKKMDQMGFIYFDTIYQGYHFFSLSDVASIPKRKIKGKLVNMLSSASYLASSGISILSIVNGIKFKDNTGVIFRNVIYKGGGLFAFGFGLSKLYPNNYIIGKKYSLALMQF